MAIEVVNYVKRKYYGTTSLSDAYKLYCEMTGTALVFGWTFDFWCTEIINGKEFHVINSYDDEVLSQYLVTKKSDDKYDAYYQMSFNEEE